MILDSRPKDLLEDFLINYTKTQNVDINLSRKIILNAMSKHSSHKDLDSYFKKIEDLWYESLKTGVPDYELYNEDYYFTDLFSCFIVYSRKYIRSLKKNIFKDSGVIVYDVLKNYNTIIDLGCGIGYSTAALKQMFPHAELLATNLEDTKQFEFCKYNSEKYDFKLYPEVKKVGKNVDMVFASEYFEHIENPLEHLNEIIDCLNPKCFVTANAFNTHALGHFDEYKNNGEIICQSKISKMFNDLLKERGYIKQKTNFWNNRPSVFIKK